MRAIRYLDGVGVIYRLSVQHQNSVCHVHHKLYLSKLWPLALQLVQIHDSRLSPGDRNLPVSTPAIVGHNEIVGSLLHSQLHVRCNLRKNSCSQLQKAPFKQLCVGELQYSLSGSDPHGQNFFIKTYDRQCISPGNRIQIYPLIVGEHVDAVIVCITGIRNLEDMALLLNGKPAHIIISPHGIAHPRLPQNALTVHFADGNHCTHCKVHDRRTISVLVIEPCSCSIIVSIFHAILIPEQTQAFLNLINLRNQVQLRLRLILLRCRFLLRLNACIHGRVKIQGFIPCVPTTSTACQKSEHHSQ